jgi:hypothetical protein
MADDSGKSGKRRIDEGYEPLQKGYTPKPPAQPAAAKPPKGGSGATPKPPADGKK